MAYTGGWRGKQVRFLSASLLLGGFLSTQSSGTSGGVSVTGLLQVAFIILKLLGKITWSWWWVLSPTWITIGLVILVLLVVFVVVLFKH